jgi:large subunit ribosomal protein L16
MLNRKRLKFKVFQKKKITKSIKNIEKTGLRFGNIGLFSLEAGIVTKRQIEATRRVITKNLKKISKL